MKFLFIFGNNMKIWVVHEYSSMMAYFLNYLHYHISQIYAFSQKTNKHSGNALIVISCIVLYFFFILFWIYYLNAKMQISCAYTFHHYHFCVLDILGTNKNNTFWSILVQSIFCLSRYYII